MNIKIIHRSIAFLIFLLSSILYSVTAFPTITFWESGELSASAGLMQIPQPVVAPAYLLFGKLFILLGLVQNHAHSLSLVSALFGAGTVLFLYLITTKVSSLWVNKENDKNLKPADVFSGILASLTFIFTDTFWSSATEQGINTFISFLFGLLIWVLIQFYEKDDENIKFNLLFLFIYILGFAVTASSYFIVLMIPAVFLVYSKFYRINIKNFFPVLFSGIALSLFLYYCLIKGVLKVFSFIDDGSGLPQVIIFLSFLLIFVPAIYLTDKKGFNITKNIIVLLFLFLLSYSSNLYFIVRAGQQPPMNANNPDSFSRLYSYVNKEQYGDTPLLSRRYGQDKTMFSAYATDFDFLLNYQFDHMFNRYLYWNFVGREGDKINSRSVFLENGNEESRKGSFGFPNKYYAIPFLLGLLGFYLHSRYNQKLAFFFLVTFLLFSYVFSYFQNFQIPQARERDYLFIPAFFVFAIYTGLIIKGITDLISIVLKNEKHRNLFSSSLLIVLIFISPVTLLKQNYSEHDCSVNKFAWEFAYNLLQSCEQDAILFTDGDNDTFPLWYLQYIEGIRTDVKVINLSLSNTPWYISQLKNNNFFGKTIPLKMSNEEIENLAPKYFQPQQINIKVSDEVIRKYNITDSAIARNKSISINMTNSIRLNNKPAIRPQEIVLLNIIKSNAENDWVIPIHFAQTCPPDSRPGLDAYLKMQGLTYRLYPDKNKSNTESVEENITRKILFSSSSIPSKELKPGFLYNSFIAKTDYLNETERSLIFNYRNTFLRLSLYYLESLNNDSMAVYVLDKMEELIPRKDFYSEVSISFDIAEIYLNAGRTDKFLALSNELEKEAFVLMRKDSTDMGSYYNPYRILMQIYDVRNDYQKELDLLKKVKLVYPNDPDVIKEINRVENKLNKSDSLNSKSKPNKIK